MIDPIEKRLQKEKSFLHNLRQKTVVRVWNLAKRLDSKAIRGQRRKDHKGK